MAIDLPPVVRLALWERLFGVGFWCHHCGDQRPIGLASQHIVEAHIRCGFCKLLWVDMFDRHVASLWS